MLDAAAGFPAALFFDAHESSHGQSTESVWIALMKVWYSMDTKYQNNIRFHPYPIISTEKWNAATDRIENEIGLSKIFVHNSPGSGD